MQQLVVSGTRALALVEVVDEDTTWVMELVFNGYAGPKFHTGGSTPVERAATAFSSGRWTCLRASARIREKNGDEALARPLGRPDPQAVAESFVAFLRNGGKSDVDEVLRWVDHRLAAMGCWFHPSAASLVARWGQRLRVEVRYEVLAGSFSRRDKALSGMETHRLLSVHSELEGGERESAS